MSNPIDWLDLDPNLNRKTLSELCSKDPRVRSRVARNRSTKIEILRILSQDLSEDVRFSIARRPALPGDIVQLFSNDISPLVRTAIAEQRFTPLDVRAKLWNDKEVLQLLISHQGIEPRENLVAIINYNTPEIILRSLSVSEDVEVRACVALNVSAPSDILANLIHDSSEWVARIALMNPSLEMKDFAEGLSKLDSETKIYFAQSLDVEPNSLLILSKDADVAVLKAAIENPRCPTEGIENVATSYHPLARALAAKSVRAPPDILSRMQFDPEMEVRRLLANNPNTPADVLERLANDDENDVRLAVASNASTPKVALEFLAEDKEYWVRRTVARNRHASARAIEILLLDSDKRVRADARILHDLHVNVERLKITHVGDVFSKLSAENILEAGFTRVFDLINVPITSSWLRPYAKSRFADICEEIGYIYDFDRKCWVEDVDWYRKFCRRREFAALKNNKQTRSK